MRRQKTGRENQQVQIEELRLRLEEAEDVLDAIRRGAVDALIVSGPDGDQVYTLTGADRAYRILYETMNEGAAVLGSGGTIFFCNAQFSKMVATPMETIIGRSIEDFIETKYVTPFAALIKNGLGVPQKKEISLKSGNGKIVPCQISTNPMFFDETSAICMILTDLTERKQAEVALRESEQRFRSIIEGAEDCIFLKDRSLTYVQVNPAFEKLIGLPANEIIGKSDEDLFDRETYLRIRETDLRVLQGDTIEDEHTRTIRSVPLRFLTTKSPIRDASGKIVGVLSVLHDVTDRRRDAQASPDAEYTSTAMRNVLNQAKAVAKGLSTILLTGESGSGKDYIAKYIHDHSDRASGPYFSINCAAISSQLAESELFGHEKGAFTGAAGKKRGLLELAEGGTLLLNEIGDLSLYLQAKLLTFLDTRKFTRVGGEKEISVSARLIAATNRGLEAAVEAAEFRKDLYYRLNVMAIPVPPLRERIDDVPILVEQILAKLRSEMQIRNVPVVEQSAIEAIKNYSWPGNVRELRNVLERAVIISNGSTITLEHLGLADSGGIAAGNGSSPEFVISGGSLDEDINNLIKTRCIDALKKARGNKKSAAASLGIARDTLYRYIEKLDISVDDYS